MFDFKINGQTISLLVSPSHAICPGYWSTSGTRAVLRSRNASAQTPRALPGVILMNWQAGLPQNGPSRSLFDDWVSLVEESTLEMRATGNKEDAR